jgi:endonuclease-3
MGGLAPQIANHEKGTYVLDLEVDTRKRINVGALGEKVFEPGRYAYVGSAFGQGGLKARVRRHKTVLTGENDTRHWHINYLA